MKTERTTRDELRILSDANANRFNVKCLSVLAFLAAASEILNEFGLFTVSKRVMLPAMILSACIFLLPVAVFWISFGRGGGKAAVTERGWFRKLIIFCAFAGTALLSVALSFHAVIFLAIPILMAAQYGDRKGEFVWILIAVCLLVPIGVYGSFFFGMPDRNLIKGALTDEEAQIVANRFRIATTGRMIEVFFHYVVPRLFGVVSIAVLAMGIARRNSRMSDRQFELSEEIRKELDRRHEMQTHVIDLLANVIETRDVNTGEHILHTKQYVEMIARAVQKDPKYRGLLTDDDIERMKNAAPLHDVGKIVIPDTILLKPGKLTPEEFDKMKEHAAAGGKLVQDFFSDIDDAAFLRTAEEIAVSHHEKWDGSGYPAGLKGEEIPLAARIMALADVYDALVSVRVYKGSIEPEAALDVIASESGSHFDPELVRIVGSISREMIAVARSRGGAADPSDPKEGKTV